MSLFKRQNFDDVFAETATETTTPVSEIVPSNEGEEDASKNEEKDTVSFDMEGRTKACNLLIGDGCMHQARMNIFSA